MVRGAFQNPDILNDLDAKTIEKLDNDWISIDEVVTGLDGIRKLQQDMTRHYNDPNVPWYMGGRGVEDESDIIVAFGGDDGEGGRIFEFQADDKKAIQETISYGESKGIPTEQLDFMEVKF